MEPRPLNALVAAAHGDLVRGDGALLIPGISTDSRTVGAGELFLALQGEKLDGHTFLAQAAGRGAGAAMVSVDRVAAAGAIGTVVAVDSPRLAYGRMAAAYRAEFALRVIAVCGSNGKTSVKALAASVLGEAWDVVASEASFNNDVGVPHTLLRIASRHQAAIVEVGTNHPGELRPLLEIVRPSWGILTSLGREHLEYFSDLEGVLREEGQLAEVLPPDGCLWINGDSPGAEAVRGRCQSRVVPAGFGPGNHWRAREVRLAADGTEFVVEAPLGGFCGTFRINLLGSHHVTNALLVMAMAAEAGLSPSQVQAGLLKCTPARMRLQARRLDGMVLLEDMYNANPDSVRAGLKTLREFPANGRRFAVLGDMAELGSWTVPAHREAGEYAAQLGLDGVFAVGAHAAVTADAARQGGIPASAFADVAAAAAELGRVTRAGDVVLVKASRSSRLEQLTELLSGAARH